MIISPGAYFWSKGPFHQFFLGGGGERGASFILGGLYMDEIFGFWERYFFVQAVVMLKFSSQPVFIIDFFTLLFLITH